MAIWRKNYNRMLRKSKGKMEHCIITEFTPENASQAQKVNRFVPPVPTLLSSHV